MPKDKGTPLMRQYMEVKDNYNDAIVLFRMGDFYETFNNDAKIVAYSNSVFTIHRRLNRKC